ncbi:MAG: DUF1343 domain-containing protein [Desulfarculales bacterium]|jgi:uncharacterized protein YbbC (DUF1343 family)|nr:DUF1343 domain-containing protein [Desulfarculales bacterium]
MPAVPGLEIFCSLPGSSVPGRLGLLCNPAAVDRKLNFALDLIRAAFPGRLKAVFGPQHGFFAEKQDNMIESEDSLHPLYRLPVYSLYGARRRPEPYMLQDLDALLVDLPDVGCRVYTFFTTLLACMEEAARRGVAIWVLDRPNPLGRGREDGPVLDPEWFSFVGPYRLPLVHSLSLGELAALAAREQKLNLDLRIIKASAWQGGDFPSTGLPWVMPSPNLPTFDSVLVYPGQVLLEGTTLSEGRGTTRPFEIFGMPGLDAPGLADELARHEPSALEGAVLRPLCFEPAFNKYQGQVCGGLQIHVRDRRQYRPLRLTLAILGALSRRQPGLWELRPPPYEYEYEKRPLDLLLGDREAADMLREGAFSSELGQRWQPGLDLWRERQKDILLY